jgi:two-component system, response regulator
LAISQEELAGRAGLHRTYVCDVERGARNVSLESIEKLARALEISTAALFSYDFSSGQDTGSRSPEDVRFRRTEDVRLRLTEEELVDILYVEDDAQDAQMAMLALKGITNRVQVVRDGESALDFLFCTGQFANRLPSHHPQLILLDLGLPKMDGLEVLRRIKSDELTATIPVVVLTGSEREGDIQTSKRLGAAAYIGKPLDMANLTRVAPNLHYQWALLKTPPAQGRRA